MTDKDQLILNWLKEKVAWMSLAEMRDGLAPGGDRYWANHSCKKLHKLGLINKDGICYQYNRANDNG